MNRLSERVALAAAAVVMLSRGTSAQQPAIRQIGSLDHVSADSFGLKSVATALAMPGGKVMINDLVGRRVLLLDSTLSRATSPADTTGATANVYGSSWATLVRYRGDSALLMVPSTLSMFVLGPNGATARVMAIPRPNEAQKLAGPFGAPGFDARGRLVYFGGSGLPGIPLYGTDMQLVQDGKPTELMRRLQQFGDPLFAVGKVFVDSSFIVRLDFDTRTIDTAAWVRMPKFEREVKVDANGMLASIATTPDPLPLIDQWTVLRDGTIAIVRGRDFHIDWIDAAGKRTSSPKVPFDWHKISDARKTALIDSTVVFWQKAYDDRADSWRRGAGRGGSGTAGRGGGGAGDVAPHVAARASLNEVPDYFPPFQERGVTSDLDNNVWVQTTQIVDNRPVYDVINRRGELIDRVQLPRYRTIAGFGPGVVYMAVVEAGGKVRLERARLR